ncbi:MAG: hypothetical protein NTW28_37790 [Candidatus Solibacter sp.]|nr:hypothetical protein [Candidatus Solibacter sp.]
MASTTQDELYRQFLAVSGQQTSAIGDATTMLADVIAQLREVRSGVSAEAAKAASASKTQTTPAATSKDIWSSAGTVATTVLKGGFGLAPLISGLVGLFSGGDAEAPAPLVKYALPAAIDFQAAESRGRMTGLEYDQMGMPRTYAEAAQSASANARVNEGMAGLVYDKAGMPRSYAEAAASGGTRSTASGAAPQITVNVQAMDARSFMDRSNDIALAVRDAMLNMNSINDVVNEL